MVCFSSSLSTLIIRSTSRKTTTTCAYTQQQRQRLHYFVHTQSFQHRNFSSTKIPDSLSSLHNDSNEIDDDDDEIIENHHQKQQKQKQQKKINIAIVGLPNAGKSFLLNRICQSKHVAAVSKKRHTTRHGILGVRNIDETQLVFVDTPGFLRSKSDANSSSSSEKQNEKLMRSLVATAGAEINKADYTLLVLDSAANKMNFKEYEDSLLILMWKGMFGDGQTQSSQLRQYNDSMNSIPTLPPSTLGVILNKVDLVTPKKKLLDTATEIGSMALACIQYYYLLNETSLTTGTGDNDNNSELQKQLSVEDHIRNMKQNHPKWQKTKSENLIEKLEQELDIDPDEQKHLEEEINDIDGDGSYNGEDNDELSKAVDMPENFLQALNEPDKYFTKEMQQHYPDVFFTSAKHKDGIDDILNHLQKIAPIREWDYEGDDASPDRSPLQKVEEIIREKIYRAVHREIPHQVDQVNRVFNFREIAIPTTSEEEEKQQQEELQSNNDNQRKKVLEIHQDLVVRSRSHQRILKGKNNMTLQRLHEQTKKDIETLFGCPVILHLHVKKTKSKQDLSNSPDSSSLLIGDDNMPW